MTQSDDRDPVDVLAEEFADRLRRGEHPSVSDYAAANPDHAEQLRELLPAVAQMEFLKRFRRGSGAATAVELPDRFGDFRIVRELGRGGMGVVFEAVQESLGRPVALKVLATHAQLDEVRRSRFIREAQAAAKLHHTNIVPVFGVGEQDGMPYYVMQLIRGEGLHAVAARWRSEQGVIVEATGSTVEFSRLETRRDHPAASGPSPRCAEGPRYGDWSFVAEIGMQAAGALHYAHKLGILHRDVKPANFILDPDRCVWVADFGLAKLVNTHALTATGDILGTLQYLAPECLTGVSDARSDVYGLGATLYELLTLRPPYPLENPARLIKQLADVAPPAPRQFNSDMPRDLETIVLKSMAREPARRYATAHDLAHDLQAFLEDRPIAARRESWAGRAWRWCRRNPTTALLSGTAAAALILAGVVGWVGYVNTRAALDAEAQRLKEAEEARADAAQLSAKLESNLKMSLKAFEKVFEAAGARQAIGMGLWARPPGAIARGRPGDGKSEAIFIAGPSPGRPPGPAGPPPLPGGPFGEAADKAAILEAILTFYDEFAEQNATNPRLQFEAAKARRRIGEAQLWLGDPKAATSFQRAQTSLEALAQRTPADDQVKIELVESYLFAPQELSGTDAEKHLLRALELAQSLPSGRRPELAGSVWFRLGRLWHEAGRKTEAETAYRHAVRDLTPPPGDNEYPPPAIHERAFAREHLASMMFDSKRWFESKTVLEESIAELRRAWARFSTGSRPPPPELRFLEAGALQRLADVYDRLNDPIAADQARAAFAELTRDWDRRFGFPGAGPKKDGAFRKDLIQIR